MIIIKFWHSILAMGARHGVNPTVFAVLYLIHHPLFWGTIAWIVVRVRKGLVVWPYGIVAAAFWLMPYAYIALNIKHIPWYVEVGGAILLSLGLYRVVQEIKKKIRDIASEAGEGSKKPGPSDGQARSATIRSDNPELVE